MIMFAGQMVGWLGREFAGHAKVNAQPAVGTETKEHLFSVGLDGTELLSGQKFGKVGWANSSEDPFSRVEMDSGDLFAEADFPLLCEVMHFCELRHKQKLWRFVKYSKPVF